MLFAPVVGETISLNGYNGILGTVPRTHQRLSHWLWNKGRAAYKHFFELSVPRL